MLVTNSYPLWCWHIYVKRIMENVSFVVSLFVIRFFFFISASSSGFKPSSDFISILMNWFQIYNEGEETQYKKKTRARHDNNDLVSTASGEYFWNKKKKYISQQLLSAASSILSEVNEISVSITKSVFTSR